MSFAERFCLAVATATKTAATVEASAAEAATSMEAATRTAAMKAPAMETTSEAAAPTSRMERSTIRASRLCRYAKARAVLHTVAKIARHPIVRHMGKAWIFSSEATRIVAAIIDRRITDAPR